MPLTPDQARTVLLEVQRQWKWARGLAADRAEERARVTCEALKAGVTRKEVAEILEVRGPVVSQLVRKHRERNGG